MKITGQITGITYEPGLGKQLREVSLSDFDINSAPTSLLLNTGCGLYSLSKWVSPKRTRSYPYQRVYDTLRYTKKITIIPVVKDEGAAGDRDFLQWDTISLMSLLDVYVVIAYYTDAETSARDARKITNQKLDNEYIIAKIREIEKYHSSALHWNLKELGEGLDSVLNLAKSYYSQIETRLGVKLHGVDGIDTFREKITGNVKRFINFSRDKATQAQWREMNTTQPKESLSSTTKAMITITNYLGGEYHFTVDEVRLYDGTVELIESKHTLSSKLPSDGDIKDGLLKMILYSNLCAVAVDDNSRLSIPVLRLSSTKLTGSVCSDSPTEEIAAFCSTNKLLHRRVEHLFAEATLNRFRIILTASK